jgi:hypothetical protein
MPQEPRLLMWGMLQTLKLELGSGECEMFEEGCVACFKEAVVAMEASMLWRMEN